MNIVKLFDDLYVIEDFLTKEELLEVNKIIDETPEEVWFDEQTRVEQSIPDFWFGKQLHFNNQETVFNSINNKMQDLFESYSYYPPNLALSRYKMGDFIKPHTDQWIPDLDHYIGYGFCLYYNDSYEGGELEYPDLNLKIKPKANSLYIHGGHILHGSLPVLNDKIRYFSTVFIRGTEELPTKLRGDLFK